jgi:hypothetical protein
VLDNYTITNNGNDFTIGKRAATWTTDPNSKTYGDLDPNPLTTGSGTFLAADNVTATYSRVAGETVAGGPYHITATLSAAAGVLDNYTITNNGNDFTIGKRAATWTTDPNSKTYGDADPSPLTTGSGTFLAADNVTATYSRVAGETVAGGPYHITATLSAAAGVLDNYTITNNGNDFTINKANATVVVTPYTLTYNGAEHTASVSTIMGVNGETGAIVGTVDVSHTAHTNAGTYASDYWFFTGGANYNDIGNTTITDTINKADATFTVTPYTLTYNGAEHTASVSTITGVNGETGATVGTVDVSHTAHTNAGTYASDYWFFTGGANYNDIGNTTITDTINKANATVVVTPYTVTYDGLSHTATYTITGVNGETGATVGTVTLNTTHTNAGTYNTDSWSFTGAANYNNVAATTITDTINKANATVVVTPYTVTYDGLPHTATYTITGVNGETGATVGTVTLNTTHTNAGTYNTDSWSFTGAANYNNIAVTTITDTINKATLTVTADNKTKILNAPNPTFTFVISGFKNGETASVLTIQPTCTSTAVTNSPVGSYPITCSGAAAANYNFNYVNATLKIVFATGGMCLGEAGHQVLQPVNADGSSVWKARNTVPIKFRICDANGVSIGGSVAAVFDTSVTGGVAAPYLYMTIAGSPAVDETALSNTPDPQFRWDASAQQWIFNLNTSNLSANNSYYYHIYLKDGSTIDFKFGLK